MKRLSLFILAALLVVPVLLLAQARTETAEMVGDSVVPPTTDNANTPLPTIEYTFQRKTYEIADITVSGANNYEDFVLIGFSGLAVGDKIEVPGEEITKSIRRFWKQGLFSDIKITATKIEGDKIWLNIALKQRPRISDLVYNGLKKSEREDVEIKVGLSKGSQMTPNSIDRAQTVIKKYFAEKGFHNTEVSILQFDDTEHPGYVKVAINVDKKEKTKVNAIYITGNEALSHNKINRVMKKTNDNNIINFFRTKKFVTEEYEKDKIALVEKYNELGYRDAYIVADSVVPSPEDPTRVDVYITVSEGEQYYVRDIHWVGNTLYPYDYLDAVLGIKKGDIYNLKELEERLQTDDDAVAKLYTDRGYLFFNIDPVEIKVEGDSIDFEMRMYEGKPATINEINIVGNTRVYEHVVRRELYTKPGQLYSQSDIMRSLRELAQMGHFDQEHLVPDIQPNPEEGTVDITYQLETKSSDQIEFSLGWGATGLVGSIGLKFTNFAIQNLFKPKTYRIVPQGEGQTFSINARTNGYYYTSASLSFLEPWLGGKRPNSLSASIYFASQTGYSNRFYKSYQQLYNSYYNSYYNNGYSDYYSQIMESESDPDKYLRTFGVSVGYGKRLRWPDDYFTFYGELSYQLFKMKDWPWLLISNGTSHNLSLGLTLSRSSIDNPIYTRRGSAFSLSVKLTPPYSLINGKDYSQMSEEERYHLIEYHKWKFSGKVFTPLTKDSKLVLMARAEFGYLGHYNQYAKSPFETFYMGGDGMTSYTSYSTEYVGMRGYSSGALTPYDAATGRNAGYVYNKFTLELRYPISLEQNATIWALVFAEAGNCYADIKDYNPFNLKRSLGLGVRIFLPMFGLMGIDWGWGFDKINGDSSLGGSQFHFILGQEL
ncbi:MAG: outer membrane protein assembly factor BamA [Paludibacter sp.]|nr:outer membrane protein assembly factor BamA [Bacteroidales bacterium]MCM1069757.1 outer membrane protein assembly factor BamA [Prevotella sp.]MCM1354442.1 outer membrane protein assembly factor BamA [Bacteroides sp.]MCM1443220.1 outer membrane protein assembly factor BamA [Muribaculum sp.]MCM1482476.1 outer membrane protein assembly factor BamA [Paludibacter sp.]